MDFAAELDKLLCAEEDLPTDPFVEISMQQTGLLTGIQKKNSELSLQIEEIYDIIKDSDKSAKETAAAVKREGLILNSFIAMTDLLDLLLQYTQNTGHTEAVAAKKDDIMDTCGLEPLGYTGERLNPRFHTVASAEYNDAPAETVIKVLECGYFYRGEVIRKATVILSKGAEIL